jgi:branched-chain amino acid transport system substrate-binding protein
MTAEQARWGFENLALDQKKLDALGWAGVMRPVFTSCSDHMGGSATRIHTWDGSQWHFSSDWIYADDKVLKPMVSQAADQYATEKGLLRRKDQDCLF